MAQPDPLCAAGGEAMVLQALEAPAVYDVDAEDVPADENPPES